MKNFSRLILQISSTVIIGWLFYSAWQGLMNYMNEPAKGFIDGLKHLLAIFLYMIAVIPGLIYSWFPLPKDFFDILIFSACSGGFYIILRSMETGKKSDSANQDALENYDNSSSFQSFSSDSNSYIYSNLDNTKCKTERDNKIIGHAGYGKRVNPETGAIQEEGLFGYLDTDTRIDPKTGKYQKEGLFSWIDTETKIDQESGIIQKEGLFGYVDTDTKVNPETGIIQKEGLFGWVDTDKRIDPETGKSQHSGLFGWVDD